VVPSVVLLALRLGFLALLWLFVLAVVLALRTDLFGPRPGRARRAAARAGGRSPAVGAPRPVPGPRDGRRRGSASGRVGRGTPRLVVTEGALAGTSIALTGSPVTIGRDDSSTLVLSDDFASSHHARLSPRDGGWLLEDLGSTNGTYLDRTRVSGPTPLPEGAPVRIGKTVLELRS